MNYFNININELVKELKEKIEVTYINNCKNPEMDEDGTYPTTSLESTIENVLTDYFDDNYEDISEGVSKEYDTIYNILFERLSNELDEEEINKAMEPTPDDYYGLTIAQRNSGIY